MFQKGPSLFSLQSPTLRDRKLSQNVPFPNKQFTHTGGSISIERERMQYRLSISKYKIISVASEPYKQTSCRVRKCCESGSIRIGIILPDTDPNPHPWPANPDPYPFQTKVKLNYNFFQKILKYCPKTLSFDTYESFLFAFGSVSFVFYSTPV